MPDLHTLDSCKQWFESDLFLCIDGEAGVHRLILQSKAPIEPMSGPLVGLCERKDVDKHVQYIVKITLGHTSETTAPVTLWLLEGRCDHAYECGACAGVAAHELYCCICKVGSHILC